MKQNPRIVSTPNMLAGVKFSPSGSPESTRFERMALMAEATAETMAAVKDSHEKESSFREANPTPPMMGMSDR